MALLLPPAARERRRAATRLLERVLLFAVLWRLGDALGETLAGDATARAPPLLRIDLARDPAWRLELLPGVGPARARAIVREREARGPPARLEDLKDIPGLGSARLDAIRAAHDVVVVLNGRPVGDPRPDPPR